MSATLRVDPAGLRAAAASQTDAGTFVSAMATGQSLTSAGAGMSGLLCGSACQFVGAVLDAAANSVHDELTSHASNLIAAADRYQHVDEHFGRRLREPPWR